MIWRAGIATSLAALCLAVATPPAQAGLVGTACNLTGLVSGVAGKACKLVSRGGRLLNAGKKLLTGHVGGAIKTLLGGGSTGSSSTAALGLAAIGVWVLGGARFALHETSRVLSNTTEPQLNSTWFSSTYWRIAGISAVLTLPFLFAAAIQALTRSDLTLLLRAAFGYLPMAFLGVSIAAPVTMVLLAASDQLSAVVASAGSHGATHFLVLAGAGAGLLSLLHGSPFLAFLVGLFTVAAAVVLWIELLAREAAVYVVVLLLPLAFAALVWPARRVWAIRTAELLVALILSKFAIVAVLALGGAALGHSGSGGIAAMLAGLVLVVMGTFAPWAMLRLVPLAELAAGAAGGLRSEARAIAAPLATADSHFAAARGWAETEAARIRDQGGFADRAVSGADVETSGAPDEAERLGNRAVRDRPAAEHPGRDARGTAPVDHDPPGAGDPWMPAGGGDPGASADPSGTERNPGMDGIWQARDNEWPTMTLGWEGIGEIVHGTDGRGSGGSGGGPSDPGMSDPGMSDPGMSDPGGSDPGGSDPGGGDSGAAADRGDAVRNAARAANAAERSASERGVADAPGVEAPAGETAQPSGLPGPPPSGEAPASGPEGR